MPADRERTPTPTPVTMPGQISRRRRPTGAAPAAGKRASWPEAAVSVTRIVAGNGVVLALALTGLLPPLAALVAVGVAMVPGLARLVAPGKGKPE